MKNRWIEIWNKREIDKDFSNLKNSKETYFELKRIDGYDLSKITHQAFLNQHEIIKNNIAKGFNGNFKNVKSIYEIGCGCGANLYMFELEGIKVGGGDYSNTLINLAKRIIKSDDIECLEAINIDENPKYDVILSNGVFEYFESIKYAEKVLEIAYKKANKVIALVDIYDETKKDDFFTFRRQNVKDFDKLYKDLPKLFYKKEFFIDFAKEHNMKLEFKEATLEGYWNNAFIFSCYMYKN